MDVRVNKARRHPLAGEVEHLRARRCLVGVGAKGAVRDGQVARPHEGSRQDELLGLYGIRSHVVSLLDSVAQRAW